MIRVYRLNINKYIIFESRKELKNCSQIAVSLKNYEQSTNGSCLPDTQKSAEVVQIVRTKCNDNTSSNHYIADCNAALSNDLKELWTNVHKNMRKLSGKG